MEDTPSARYEASTNFIPLWSGPIGSITLHFHDIRELNYPRILHLPNVCKTTSTFDEKYHES